MILIFFFAGGIIFGCMFSKIYSIKWIILLCVSHLFMSFYKYMKKIYIVNILNKFIKEFMDYKGKKGGRN
jgi:hypothetical protein